MGLPAEVSLALPETAQILPNGLILPDGLSYDQWSEVGMTLKQATKSLPWWVGDWLNYGDRAYGERYTQALDATDYEYETLRACKWVAERIETVRRRTVLSWAHHKEVAGLEPEEQDALLENAEVGEWTRKELRSAVREYKRQLAAPQGPTDKFRVVYADPPWRYSDELIEGYGAAEHHYPTMAMNDICALPVQEWVADDAVLFLWATSPFLEDAFSIIAAWGFTYKTSFVWDKVRHNYGHYNSVRHELLLVATRGSCVPDNPELHDSVIEIERTDKHSQKPEYFRELIDQLYTHGDRIELFARVAVTGWTAWGNENLTSTTSTTEES